MTPLKLANIRLAAVASVVLAALCFAQAAGDQPRLPLVQLPPRQVAPSSDTRVGVNLDPVSLKLDTIVFVDGMKQSTGWSSGGPLRVDEDGNVVTFARGQIAQTTIGPAIAYPPGDYTLVYDGTGDFVVPDATIVRSKPGETVVRFTHVSQSGIRLLLVAVDPSNYPRNIHFILPGFDRSYVNQPFHPSFLAALSKFRVLRFGGWSRELTYARSTTWASRPSVARVTQTGADGVAPEYQIALANATGEDPWFVLPVGATDYYVAQFAELVYLTLDPRLHPIFEYGCAVLNPGSPDNSYAEMAGENFHLAADPQQAALHWYIQRSARVFSIIERIYGFDTWRVTRVISGPLGVQGSPQAGLDEKILDDPGVRKLANAFAVEVYPGLADSAQSNAFATALEETAAFARAHWLAFFAFDGTPDELNLWRLAGGGLFVTNTGGLTQTASSISRFVPFEASPSPSPSNSSLVPHFPKPVLPRPGLHNNSPIPFPLDVTTYHYDNSRTGWDTHETQLTQSVVNSSKFGEIGQLAVDGNVLAQPLFVSQYQVPGQGTHNLLIVATENNSVYAYDDQTLAQLWHINLGTPQGDGEVGCGDVTQSGISATPVIERTGPGSGTLYVVASTEPSTNNFEVQLHALDLGTGLDLIPPVDVNPTGLLSNGSTISFDPETQYNRTGLFISGGYLYVGAGSHCDDQSPAITGWLLRYTPSLTLVNQFATDDDSAGDSLASIWMTGFPSAVDSQGNIFLATGNGAFDADTGGLNYGESVLKLTPDLSSVLSYFTPQNYKALNQGDQDLGSGGVVLIPGSSDLVARGKDGRIFLLSQSDLGGLQSNNRGALQIVPDTHGTWGGAAYYFASDGTKYIYYQGDHEPLSAYTFSGSLSPSSKAVDAGGYGGSAPIVSSNGTLPGTGIVWVAQRGSTITLEAYDATNVRTRLFGAFAGTWSNPEKNSFVSPLVADGRVFVGASGTVTIFGLGATANRARIAGPVESAFAHHLTGTIVGVRGNWLALRLRGGQFVQVNIAAARVNGRTGVLPQGHAVVVYGSYTADGVFHVTSIGHAAPSAADWPPDTR
jgi:hypothetical protein